MRSLTTLAMLVSLTCASKAIAHDYQRIIFSQDGAGAGSQNAILRANPASGGRVVISQPGVRGNGPDFGSLIGGLVLDPAGNILLTGFDAGTIFKVDPLTGDREILSSDAVGTGPSIHNVNDLIVVPNGDIFVTAQDAQALVRIDPLSGNRSVVSGPGMGSGPLFGAPFGVAQAADGSFYVYDANEETVTHVDATTGDRTILSGAGFGSGPEFGQAGTDLALMADGNLATTNSRAIFRVDSQTGERSVLTGQYIGDGPEIVIPNFLTVANDGGLIAADVNSIYRVDPVTGDRDTLTGNFFGKGPELGIYRQGVVTVPEPSSLYLALLALGTVAIGGRRRSGRL